jgi:hypothetical protein
MGAKKAFLKEIEIKHHFLRNANLLEERASGFQLINCLKYTAAPDQSRIS